MKIIVLIFLVIQSAYALNPGDKALDFTLIDQEDKVFNLSQLKGKYIILEWYNYGCPYVKKHYSSGNMQTIQRLYKNNDLVKWVSIVSSAKNKQGYLHSAKNVQDKIKEVQSHADYMLRDFDGKVGQSYEARSTPHIFIIDPDFKIQYMGAIDSIASADIADIKNAKNYITSTISKLMLKNKPDPQKTRAYGCSIKY